MSQRVFNYTVKDAFGYFCVMWFVSNSVRMNLGYYLFAAHMNNQTYP